MRSPSPQHERVAKHNPLAPYSWEAKYYGGGRLKQFDVDGYHASWEIELPRLESLIVHGPCMAYELPRPYDRSRPITRMNLFARNQLNMDTGHSVEFIHFGIVYEEKDGEKEFYVRFHQDGRMMLYTPDKPHGELVDIQ